jgi:TMEM175 potassium channel family protein
VIAPSEESRDGPPAGTSGGHPAGTSGGPPADSAPADGTDDPQVEASAAERVIFFSDAVVAIAITLLALALPVPGGFPGMTNGQLLHALDRHWPDYLAFLISFLVIGNHWVVHRQIFRYASRVNRKVTVPNMGWLLMMILTPFATRMLAGTGGFGVRFSLYALIQVIASACLLLMSREIARGRLLRPGAPESATHPDHAPSVAIIVAFLVSIPVSFFTGWAFALWATAPPLARVLRRLRGSGTVDHEPARPRPGHQTRQLGPARGVTAAGPGSLLFPLVTGIPS